MGASDARPIPRKNVAYRVTFPIYDADGDLVAGAAGLDSEVSGDGGTFADCTNEATEIATGSGMYYLDLTSGEMNYDTVAIIVKTSTTGAKTTSIVLYPEEAGDVRADVVQISGDAAAADNAEAFFDGTGYAGTNNVIPAVTTVNGLATGVVTAAAIATGAIDADAIAADAVTEIQAGLATASALATVDGIVDLILADTGTDGVVLTSTERNNIADAILSRDWSAVTGETARSVLNALRFLRNKWSISGTTLTVTKEDDATIAWTASLTTDGAADPVTGSDPA